MLFITSFSAVLVLLWDYLLSFEFTLNVYYLVTVSHCEDCYISIGPLLFFLLPILDCWLMYGLGNTKL